jgi:hypothetical protein
MPAQPIAIDPESIAAQPKPQHVGSCTFLNMSGDITIVWDENNREQVLEVIRKKMKEGYTFFTTKRFLFDRLSRRVAVTNKNLGEIESLVITDEEFERMVEQMNDADVAALVRDSNVAMTKRRGKKDLAAMARLTKPEDVIERDSLAVRPIAGG